MNKILVWIRNITFLIVTILILMSFNGLGQIGVLDINYSLWATTLIIIIFIQLIVLMVRKSKVNDDKWYSYLMIGANIIFIMIYLRTMFDTSIVTTYLGTLKDNPDVLGYRYMFLHYNLPWIIFMYSILFIYPITYFKLKIKKNEK